MYNLQGKDETDQIGKIMDVFGAITPQRYPGCQQLPFYNRINVDSYPPQGRAQIVSDRDGHDIDEVF
jgi:hypothetical protein